MARSTTADRKSQILHTAIEVFATNGFYKTTTAMIANVAGVTQPYLFHFFKTKEDLYLAVLETGVQKIYDAFEQVQAPPQQLMLRMGEVFQQLLEQHRNELLLTMFSFTTVEPRIRQVAKENHLRMFELISNKFASAGIPNAAMVAKQFIGMGLMISLSSMIEAPQLSPYEEDVSC